MFGIDIFDASLLTAMLVALFAGVLSFLSPCVLPIVPPYLAYMGGISMRDMTDTADQRGQRRAVMASLFFALGLLFAKNRAPLRAFRQQGAQSKIGFSHCFILFKEMPAPMGW